MLFLLLITACSANYFIYYPTNKLTHLDNWQNKEKPCIGDHIVFEEAKNIAAYFDEDIQVDEIQLPEDGALYFADNVAIGKPKEPNGYQCSRRKSPEDIFFDVEIPFGNFHNPSNWIADQDQILHMNMVPGANDDVMFANHTLQLFIEDQAKVSRLHIQGRELTSEEFERIAHTVEGQFRVNLGHSISKKYSLDGVEFMIPNKPPILVKPKKVSDREERSGVANPNRDHQVMALICQYVKCPRITDDFCVKPVKPIGHCCHVCGATINFSGMELHIEPLRERIRNIIKITNNAKIAVNLERLDEDRAPIDYQITLLPNQTEDYDEELLTKVVYAVEKLLSGQKEHFNMVVKYNHSISMIDRNFQPVSKVLGIILSAIILFGMLVYVIKKDANIHMPKFKTGEQPSLSYSGVMWKRGRTEDHIQLVNPNHSENQNVNSESASEEENNEICGNQEESGKETCDQGLINPIHEELPMVDLAKPYSSNDSGEDVEELPLVDL